MNRKGIIFTLIALLLSGMFIILYTTEVRTPFDYKVDLYAMKAANIKGYTDNLEEYTRYTLSIGGHEAMKTLIDYEQYTMTTFENLEDLRCAFADTLIDGTFSLRVNEDAFEDNPAQKSYLAGTIDNQESQSIYQNAPFGNDYLLLNHTKAQDNVTYSFLVNFTAQNKGSLENATLYINNTVRPLPTDVIVSVYEITCNDSIFLIDQANVSIPSGWVSPPAVTFPFRNHAYLRQSQSYLFMITANNSINIGYNTNPGADEYEQVINHTLWHNFTNDKLIRKSSIDTNLGAAYNLSREELAIGANHTLYNLTISHLSSWDINVAAYLLLRITDNFSSYDKRTTITSSFSIAGLNEPLIALNLNQSRPIRKAPFDIDTRFNLSILTNFTLENYTWARYNDTPNFLYRMLNWTNNTGNYGIETILKNLEVGNKSNTSYADWQFFNDTTYPCGYVMRINTTRMRELKAEFPTQFPDHYTNFWDENNETLIDIQSLVRYQVNNTFWNTTCIS
ncbi:MAG: hypothetical protein ABIJ21_05260 [Nanoarchaeota archaeon]